LLVVTASPPAPRAADGRVPGRRGLATRQRLLDHVAEMLAAGSYRDLRVVDVARSAGTSPATFYQYFADVEGSSRSARWSSDTPAGTRRWRPGPARPSSDSRGP
jgi:AraC-like DNA-binding protein